jgi:hypothetical protein
MSRSQHLRCSYVTSCTSCTVFVREVPSKILRLRRRFCVLRDVLSGHFGFRNYGNISWEVLSTSFEVLEVILVLTVYCIT